jgi:TolA-binding protein
MALILLLVASACASRKSVETLRQQVQELQRENFRLRKDLTEARVRLQMQAEKGASPARSRSETASRKAPASGSHGIVVSEPLEPVESGPAIIYSEPITDASAYTSGPLDAMTAEPGRSISGSARSLMDAAQASLDARDPEAALVHFREIVVNHPDDAIADDAQFGVGECYFQMGQYEEAIVEYRRVIDGFPFGDRVAYAFLKIGFSQLALEQRDEALDSFRTVSEAYPGTEAATVARQQIAHLTR